MKNRFLLLLFCTLLPFLGMSQGQGQPEMADLMRSNGKIYVVVAVLALVLVGLLVYVFILDRKISRIEKEGKEL